MLKKFMMIILMGAALCVLITRLCSEALNNTKAILETVGKWHAMELHTSITWLLQDYLASLSWLGPMRPDAPQNPLEACGNLCDFDGWAFVFKPYATKRCLKCLDDNITKSV